MRTLVVRALVAWVAILAPLSACGGLVDDYETPSGSTTSSAPGAGASSSDGGAPLLTADAAIATTSPAGCDAPALACTDVFPGAVPYSSSTADALVGVWIFCPTAQSEAYPSPYVGEEYAADGTYYSIIQDGDGDYVRDLDPGSIGRWKVSEVHGGGPGLFETVISEAGGTSYGEYGMSTCPRSLIADGALELPAR